MVTAAQNPVRASDAGARPTPSDVRYSCDQLPFIVSQIPYRSANAPNIQKPAGIRSPPPSAW